MVKLYKMLLKYSQRQYQVDSFSSCGRSAAVFECANLHVFHMVFLRKIYHTTPKLIKNLHMLRHSVALIFYQNRGLVHSKLR